jgi:hypothetical protein
MVVEPDWTEGLDHLGAAVAEAFEFDVGMVDVVLDKGGVEVSDGWQVTAVPGAAGDQNSQAAFHFPLVLFEQLEHVVIDVVFDVRSQEVVGVNIGHGRIKVLGSPRHVPCLAEQRAEQFGILDRQSRRSSTTHRESFDTPSMPRGDRATGPVDEGDHLFDKHRLDRKPAVERVFVERAFATIRQYEDHRRPFSGDDAFVQNLDVFKTVKFVPAVAMQVIDHRVTPIFVFLVAIPRRQVKAVPNVLSGRFAVKRPVSDSGRKLFISRFVYPDDGRSGRLLSLLLSLPPGILLCHRGGNQNRDNEKRETTADILHRYSRECEFRRTMDEDKVGSSLS